MIGGLPDEAVGLLKRYLDGSLGTFEFASLIEAVRTRQSKMVPALGP